MDCLGLASSLKLEKLEINPSAEILTRKSGCCVSHLPTPTSEVAVLWLISFKIELSISSEVRNGDVGSVKRLNRIAH